TRGGSPSDRVDVSCESSLIFVLVLVACWSCLGRCLARLLVAALARLRSCGRAGQLRPPSSNHPDRQASPPPMRGTPGSGGTQTGANRGTRAPPESNCRAARDRVHGLRRTQAIHDGRVY